jgi:hypothetical protein
MDKIQITDLIDEDHKEQQPQQEILLIEDKVSPKKRKKTSVFTTLMNIIRNAPTNIATALGRMSIRTIFSSIKKLNVYRKIREGLIRFYLKRTVANTPVNKDNLLICWQPVPFILVKIGLVAVISYQVYGFYTLLGKWLKEGFDFFKLQDIYNFEFPKQPFFDTVAIVLLLFIICYHGLYFLYNQLLAFLSVLVVNKVESKVYIVKNVFIRKELFVFSIPDIALVILRQNILARIFGIGTIALEKKSGELVEIKSVMGARAAAKLLSAQPAGNGEPGHERV